MKDKSIKSTMKSWIMLSEKELDDTQVYMQEQEQQDQQEKDNSFSEAESGSGGSVIYSGPHPPSGDGRKRPDSGEYAGFSAVQCACTLRYTGGRNPL